MGLRDFLLLVAICFVWGLNVVLTRWVVFDEGVAPVFFAAVRFGLVGLLLLPLLRPVPRDWGMLLAVAMSIGAAHFALLFLGLAGAEASAVAVVGQLGVPFSTLLSIVLLGERIHWRRALGIVMAFAGVMVIAVDPASFSLSTGLLFVVGSAFIGALGGVLMKRLTPMPALRLQAWTGAVSVAPLLALSLVLEPGAAQGYAQAGWPVWLATVFAVVGVSLFGHGSFYTLVKRHEISLLAPLTLMTPIFGVLLGIGLLGEPASPKLLLGGALALSGVLIIALRPNARLPDASIRDKLPSPPT
jgi:O-acetylserine/cysteine efflux transporter